VYNSLSTHFSSLALNCDLNYVYLLFLKNYILLNEIRFYKICELEGVEGIGSWFPSTLKINETLLYSAIQSKNKVK